MLAARARQLARDEHQRQRSFDRPIERYVLEPLHAEIQRRFPCLAKPIGPSRAA
jgi:hypothetical protein